MDVLGEHNMGGVAGHAMCTTTPLHLPLYLPYRSFVTAEDAARHTAQQSILAMLLYHSAKHSLCLCVKQPHCHW